MIIGVTIPMHKAGKKKKNDLPENINVYNQVINLSLNPLAETD
jgi:hypothetical protein